MGSEGAPGEEGEGLSVLRESEALAVQLGDELRLSEAREALAGVTSAPNRLPEGLTSRQGEILGLVAAGCSNREIASRLYLSERTVERHLENIYRKVGFANRVEATRFALTHGLGTRT